MPRPVLVAAAVVVASLLAAAWWFNRPAPDALAACSESAVGTGVASIGGPLSLVDENGVAVTDKEMFTKPTLLYFGYTFCPDVCPLDNARNAEALDKLAADGYDAQMAFISVDPDRDDPERLRDFTDFIHPKMTGYTGTMAQIQAAAKAYKAFFRKEDNGDPDYYLVDHSTFTYLVLPDRGFVEFFKRDDTPDDMARRVECFVDATG